MFQQQTGKTLDLLQFTAAFISRMVPSGEAGHDAMNLSEATEPEELVSLFAITEDHADPGEARGNFSMPGGK